MIRTRRRSATDANSSRFRWLNTHNPALENNDFLLIPANIEIADQMVASCLLEN